MKHIGWCLEKIQVVMSQIPKYLSSDNAKLAANTILDEVQKYASTLAQLILYPKFKKDLHQLETSSIEGVRLQAHEIEELFKDLEHMLYVLDLYIKELREIITKSEYTEEDSKRWQKARDQLVLMIDQKFGGEMGELRKEFQVALHTEEELKQLVTSEKHLAEFLR